MFKVKLSSMTTRGQDRFLAERIIDLPFLPFVGLQIYLANDPEPDGPNEFEIVEVGWDHGSQMFIADGDSLEDPSQEALASDADWYESSGWNVKRWFYPPS